MDSSILFYFCFALHPLELNKRWQFPWKIFLDSAGLFACYSLREAHLKLAGS